MPTMWCLEWLWGHEDTLQAAVDLHEGRRDQKQVGEEYQLHPRLYLNFTTGNFLTAWLHLLSYVHIYHHSMHMIVIIIMPFHSMHVHYYSMRLLCMWIGSFINQTQLTCTVIAYCRYMYMYM